MLATNVVTLAAAIFGLATSILGSTAYFYSSSRANRSNLRELKGKLRDLKILVEGLEKRWNGIAVFKPEPSQWFEEAKSLLRGLNISELENQLEENCGNGSVPNFFSRYEAARLIHKKIREVEGLLDRWDGLSQESIVKGNKLPDINIVGESRKEVTREIRLLVSQGEVGAVCIHGGAGVGKTVVAAAVHNQVLQDMECFDYVFWVSFEHGFELKQVQEEIARSISVELSSATNNAERAKTLHDALIRKKRFLLVLDSIWQAFSLEDVGIPDPSGGCKLIVTSRMHSVCRTTTRHIKKKEIFEIKPLSEDEAWELFKAELDSNLPDLQKETVTMTKKAIRELDGVSLAVKKLAEMLSGIPDTREKIDIAWREELISLKKSKAFLGNKWQDLLDCFKCSYEILLEHSQSCLMYCALFPKGHSINVKELIEYWMCGGLLGEIESLEESTVQGKKILRELKDARLLENVSGEGEEERVKILNIVRHMIVDVMAKGGREFLIKSGNSLTELPIAEDWPEQVEAASFMKNQLSALRNNPSCRQLSTLLVQDNPLNSRHRKNFFSRMRNLRVLDLSCTLISSLPKSLSDLTNLCALLLRNCPNLTRLPLLSNLRRLVILDVSKTPLEQWPDGMPKSIRRLNLSRTRLEVIPQKAIAELTQLEELLLITDDRGGYIWGSNQVDSQWTGACVEELAVLVRLTNLQLNFLNTKVFEKFVEMFSNDREKSVYGPHGRYPSFKFCVGGFCNETNMGENSIGVIGDYRIELPVNTSELHLMMSNEVITSLKIKGSLRDLSVLDISNFDRLIYLFTLEMLGSLKNLKRICVKRCEKMKALIQPAAEANPTSITLTKLVTLMLFDLPKMESICHGQVLNCPSLRALEVWSCHKLKLPTVLLGRNNGILEIKGDKEWLDKMKDDSPSSISVFKFSEAPVPPELSSTPRVRRPLPAVSSNVTSQSAWRRRFSVPFLTGPALGRGQLEEGSKRGSTRGAEGSRDAASSLTRTESQ